ncbi:MAG: arginase [Gammaproteobacteria bacterium]|nr:arginase [Gammaproteobacteria bacterium]
MQSSLAIDVLPKSPNGFVLPGLGRTISVIGAPIDFGASKPGPDLGPESMRAARLNQRLAQLGYEVQDRGDVHVRRPQKIAAPDENPKYLAEITDACDELAGAVHDALNAGQLPLVLGGDHSIAIGSLSGVASYFRQQRETFGLIWFDAHADMNTPETSPSGNIHGMPLASLLGYGAKELVNLRGFAPKLDLRFCAHIGARDLDDGERELIRQLGIRFFTMREVDQRGMSACVDDAIAIASQASGGYAVTFDVDAIDPIDAPGSGTLVRGGLMYREAHLAMEKIAEAGGMRSLEVVEINPSLDVDNRTTELGVELILSALGKTII